MPSRNALGRTYEVPDLDSTPVAYRVEHTSPAGQAALAELRKLMGDEAFEKWLSDAEVSRLSRRAKT